MGKNDKDIINAFKTISESLHELENKIKVKGYEIPKNQPEFDNEFDKINFPKGYIRQKNFFIIEYHLNDICDNNIHINNIAYSLQYTDLLNYIINRFCITLSIRSIYIKYAIINTFSVFEAILHSSLTKIRNTCFQNGEVCKTNVACSYYISQNTLSNFSEKISFINDNIINLNTYMKHIKDTKSKRDNVHIWTSNDNEFLSGIYNLQSYNKQILLLQKIKLEYPNAIITFNNKKGISCKYC